MYELEKVLLIFYTLLVTLNGTEFIPCPLSWSPGYFGMVSNIPSKLVNTQLQENLNGEETYLARKKISEGFRIVEVFSNFTIARIGEFEEENEEDFGSEILTNPFNCSLKWISVEDKLIPMKYLVPIGTGNELIGGVLSNSENSSDTLTPCSLKFGKAELCSLNQGYRKGVTWSNTFVLKSYTKLRLDIHLQNFRTLNQTTVNYETNNAGCDMLSNKGDAEISKTVTHSTETSNKWTITLEGGVALGLNGQVEFELAVWILISKRFYGSISLHLALDLEINIGGDYSQDTKDTVSTTQRVNIPPGSVVEVCFSLVKRNVQTYFEAEGAIVTHPFLKAPDLLKIIERDARFSKPIILHEMDEEVIKVGMVHGFATVTQPLNTNLVVGPINKLELQQLV